jgi:CBS domain-containing protein
MADMRVKDVMTTRVISVAPETDVREVARILLSNRISGAPVVDGAGRVLGMLTEGDLMRRADIGSGDGGEENRAASAAERAGRFVKSHGLHAADVMTRPVLSVSEDTALDEVATLFEANHVKRVPVLRDGRLVGIVSRANLLHGLIARWRGGSSADDWAIRAAIVQAIENVGVRRHSLNVVISNGTAYLWGIAQSQAERDAVRVAAETTPGVKRVENHLFVFPPGSPGAHGGF